MDSDLYLFQMLKGGVDKQTRDTIGASIAKTLRESLNPPPPAPLGEADNQAIAESFMSIISYLSSRRGGARAASQVGQNHHLA